MFGLGKHLPFQPHIEEIEEAQAVPRPLAAVQPAPEPGETAVLGHRHRRKTGVFFLDAREGMVQTIVRMHPGTEWVEGRQQADPAGQLVHPTPGQ